MADVSYVITSYNNRKYLKASIESVLGQSRPVKEIILVDDASTDGSQDLLKSFAASHPEIRLELRENNVGAGMNRHLGFLKASSQFVTNLAGDDTIHIDKVKNEMGLLEAGADVAFSNCLLDHPDRSRNFIGDTGYFAALSTPVERVAAVMSRSRFLPHHMIYSKELYLEVGGYDVTADLYEDWSIKLRLANADVRWVHTGELGLIYNRHGTGLSASPQILHAYWELYVIANNYHWLSDRAVPADIRACVARIAKRTGDNPALSRDGAVYADRMDTALLEVPPHQLSFALEQVVTRRRKLDRIDVAAAEFELLLFLLTLRDYQS